MLAALARLHVERENPIAELYRRKCDAFNARDWAAIRSVWPEDVVSVDRRPMTGWPVLRGRAESEAWLRHLLTMSPDLQWSFKFIEGDAECGIVCYKARGHATESDGGGELDLSFTHLSVVRGGLTCYIERYTAEADLDMLRARCGELRPLARRRAGAELPIEPLPVEHATLRFTAAIDAGDWTAVTTMLDPRLVVLDHRGADPEDRESFVARLRARSGGTSRYTVFAASDSVSAGVLAAGGDTVGAVMDWQPGTCRGIELFGADDEAGMLAALARLRAAASAPSARAENP
jgi:ketosteroid isomerase-like protein